MESIRVAHDPFRGGEIDALAPTTEPQREVLAAAAMDAVANTAYNESVSLRIEGVLDDTRIEAALRVLVERHDALRAAFTPDLGSICVASRARFVLERRRTDALDEAAREAAVRAVWSELVTAPMPLYEGPLFRAVLLRFAPERAELVLAAHHAVCDGWSFHRLLGELEQLLDGNPPESLPVAASFAAFARELAQRTERNRDESFWRERFRDRPEPVDLPTDRPRPVRRGFAGARLDLRFGAVVLHAVRSVASQQGASLVHVLVAGVVALVRRLTASDDVVLAMPFARQALDDRPSLVGHCVQLLPLRFAAGPDTRFHELIEAAKRAVLEAGEHFDFTFGSLVRELGYSGDASRVPLAPVLVNVDQPLAPLRLGAARAIVRSVPRTAESFELFLNFAPEGDALSVEATYNTELFGEATIRTWLHALERLLVASASAAERLVDAIPIVADERAAATFSGPVNDGAPACWLERCAWHASARGESAAVVDGAGSISYRELMARAQGLAADLARRGVGRGDAVAVCTSRSRELLVALAGIHLAGAVYLPLDRDHPSARLLHILDDAGARWIVADGALPEEIERSARSVIDPTTVSSIDGAPAQRWPSGTDGAYLLYTSGTTGVPKGVRVPHRALSNVLASFERRPGFATSDALLAVTTIVFDISILELLLPLYAGGRVVVATREEAEDPRVLAHLLARHDITFLEATPALWRILVESGWQGDRRLRALSGGERLSEDLAAALLSRVRALWNGYGPTETAIYSSLAEVRDPERSALVGTPIANTAIHVLDHRGAVLPRGVPGEICIGGAGLADGYHARTQLTAERFVEHLELGRVFRTGDRGRIRHDGDLECLGRLDRQVKLNGFRIELGDVETALCKHPGIADAAVALHGERGSARLVGYVVRRASAPDAAEIAQHLRAQIPAYMIPHQWVALDALPRLPNGKLDRRNLPSPALSADVRAEAPAAPSSELERTIREVMARLAPAGDLGPDSDFFAAGGHSLLAAQLAAELGQILRVELSMRDVFEAPTPRLLAAAIADGRRPRAPRAPIERCANRREAPTTALQERIWYVQQMLGDRPTYNLPSAHRLRGTLDPRAFRSALLAVVARQSVLRTTFERRGREIMQIAHATLPDAIADELLPLEDLSAIDARAREQHLRARLEECISQPFDPGRLPLFRTRLFRLAEDEHVFFFMPHHIVWDGWSFDIFYGHFAAAYAACAAGRTEPLKPLEIEHGDFAAWSRARANAPDVQRQSAHWVERLRRFGPVPPLRDAPVKRSGMSGNGATEWLSLDARQTHALRELARERGATLFVATLAIYALLLREVSGRETLLLAIPSRGREEAGLESMMGCCNNLLPLVIEFHPTDTVEDVISRTKQAVIESLSTPDVLLEQLVERRSDASTVMYQALFSFQDVRHRVVDWGGLKHERVPVFARGATEDLGLWFVEAEQGLRGGMTFHVEVFDAATVQGLRARFLELVERVLAAPATSIEGLCDRVRWLVPVRANGSRSEVGSRARPAATRSSHAEGGAGESELARKDYEVILAQIWQRVLGVERVELDDDFFDLGGDSLRAIEVVRRLEESSGLELELGEVFQKTTIAELAASLHHHGKRPRRLLIPLQTEGPGTPLFCLLGIWIYRHLARALGRDHPVYGIYVPEEKELLTSSASEADLVVSIDGFASAYLAVVRETQPEGPYRLAGVSFGGVIAMEVARRLQREGARVDHVVLLDTALPNSYRRKRWRTLASKVKRLGREVLLRFPRPGAQRRAQRVRAASGTPLQLNPAFWRACESATREWMSTLGEVRWPVTLVRAVHPSPGYELDADYGWGALLGSDFEVVALPGDHMSILQPGRVEELGARLRTSFASDAPKLASSR